MSAEHPAGDALGPPDTHTDAVEVITGVLGDTCTPAERALVDAALAWRANWPWNHPVGTSLHRLSIAADRVLADRGERHV